MALPVHAAPFEDTMAQRMLACTGCHGAQGRSAPDGYYPRIAGKPAGYLLHQLQNFREGRRSYAPMARLLAPLDDHYLRQIAEHFAALNLPYPPPAPGLTDAARLADGERLVRHGDAGRQLPACTTCHGRALTGVAPAVPGLLGLPRDYLNSQLGAWRDGSRRAHGPDCMAELARRLNHEDINSVSQWLASQPLPADTRALTSAAALDQPMPIRCGSVEAAQKTGTAMGAGRP
jgi:cytochrome c553